MLSRWDLLMDACIIGILRRQPANGYGLEKLLKLENTILEYKRCLKYSIRGKLQDFKRRLSDRKMYSIVVVAIAAVAMWEYTNTSTLLI